MVINLAAQPANTNHGILGIVQAPGVFQPLEIWFDLLEQRYAAVGIVSLQMKCYHLRLFLEQQLPETLKLQLNEALEQHPEIDLDYEHVKQSEIMGNNLGRHDIVPSRDDVDDDQDAGLAIFRPPAFNRQQPVQWFAAIEQHFEAFEITSDAAKCELLIDELDLDMLQLIEADELCSPEFDGERYENIKQIVLQLCLPDCLARKY